MENKINIAELLKDCPQGMELYSPIFGEVYLDEIRPHLAIVVTTNKEQGDFKEEFLYDGRYGMNGECMLFPKGKTTWEGFVPPCKFKDADIVAVTIPHTCTWVGIFKQYYINNEFESYCFISANGIFNNIGLKNHVLVGARLASEEEQQKLFQAIKDNGYHWNEKTKTLEKLIKPKFKVGDRIRRKGETSTYTITYVNDAHYFSGKYVICDTCDDDWELVPNKFDINTLKPFESKVLIRDTETEIWYPAFWGFYDQKSSYPYKVIGGMHRYCIPYESNEYLLGTTEDCDEYYKNW